MKKIDIEDIEKHEEEQEQEIYTIFHKVEDYLDENYDLRYNTIKLDVEISQKGADQWESVNIDALWIELQKKEIKIAISALQSIIRSSFIAQYNPLKEYFNRLPKWNNNQKDFIKQYANYVKLLPNENLQDFENHLKKWLVRVVRSIFEESFFNKQAFVLADNGKGQNIGKTTYLRNLMSPKLREYIAEDIGTDKDGRILLCKNMLINLDELATLNRTEINHLKAYFTKTQINERLPYDRKNTIIARVASFMGSTNQTTFLRDETGSVRWLIFGVQSIDWAYSKDFDIDNLWAQAYALYKNKNFNCTMTREDIEANERRNKKYQVISVEQELISKFFRHPNPADDGLHNVDFMTATEIGVYLKVNGMLSKTPSNVMIGKALHALGYLRQYDKDSSGSVRYGYKMVIIEDKILKQKTLYNEQSNLLQTKE